MPLTARENFLEVVRFGRPEYVPYSRKLPVQRIGFFGVNPEDNRPNRAEMWTDLWQVRHHQRQEGVMPFPVYHPLEHLEDWDDYSWPDPRDPALYANARRAIIGIANRAEIILEGSHRSTLLERAWKLVGMENLFMMLASEPERVDWLLDRILAFQLGVAEQYVGLGIEMAALGDDHGTHLGPMISPEHFRRFFKPRYTRLIQFYKSKNCLVSFHSCGNILDIVPEFIDLGIDLLNPVQATANNLAALREKTLGKIALQGAVNTATVMKGPVEQIRAEVRERINTLGQRGGYVCGPDQGLPFPPGHLAALEAAVTEFGRYGNGIPRPNGRKAAAEGGGAS